MTFNIVRYSQQDPLWKNINLGSGSDKTIGSSGDALTSISMLLSGYGYLETPATLNDKLINNEGISGGIVDWAVVSSIYPKVIFRNLVTCLDSDAPIDAIRETINAGQPVLLEVHFSPSPSRQTHWVVAYADDGTDFYILDPWPYPTDTQEVTLTSRYSRGNPLQRSIISVVWYDVSPSEGNSISQTSAVEDSGLTVQVVVEVNSSGLRLRAQPSTIANQLALEPNGTLLEVTEEVASAEPKIGVISKWLRVRDPNGLDGYVAAWYVRKVEPGTQPLPVYSSQTRTRRSVGDGLDSIPLQAPTAQQLSTLSSDSALVHLIANIWNQYGGLLIALSNVLNIDPGVAAAVLAIESGGQAFDLNNRMIIRFEVQVFYQQWGKDNREKFNKHFMYDEAQRWTGHKYRLNGKSPWIDVHSDQSTEWAAFDFARNLNEIAALMSISMGAPQIMGFNYSLIGYRGVGYMYKAFSTDIRNQIFGFFDFIQGVVADDAAIKALQTGDFESFAIYYNGTGQTETYTGLIKNALDIFDNLRTRQISLPPQPIPPEPTSPPAGENHPLIVLVSSLVGSSGLRLRRAGSLSAGLVTVEPAGAILTVLDSPEIAQTKIGTEGSWLWVQDLQGRRGYVAAWYVELSDNTVSPGDGSTTTSQSQLMIIRVSSLAGAGGLRIRRMPTTSSDVVKVVKPGTSLIVLDPPDQVETRIGVYNEWIKIRDPLGAEGYVAAWFVENS
jgi:hypothetical protein